MCFKSWHISDRSEIFSKLVLCVWAGIGKTMFSDYRRQLWLGL